MECILSGKFLNSIRLFNRLAHDLPGTNTIDSNQLIRDADKQQGTIGLVTFNPINFSYSLFDQFQRPLTLTVAQQSRDIDVAGCALRVRQLTRLHQPNSF